MDIRQPTISVITVCYNSAGTLARAIESVVNQDYPHVQHILIDGGSSDGTAKILAKFESHFAHVVSEPDRGIYDAMNKGLSLASGNIICFLNADDAYASPTVLSTVAKEMQLHELDAFLGDVGFFHENNPEKMVRRYRANRFKPNRLAWGWMPAHPALFLTKSVVDRAGKFKINYRIAGDFEFIVRAFHGKTMRYQHYSEVLVHMQMGGASTAGWRSKWRLNQEVLRACRENGIRTNIFKILSKYPFKLLELFFL